MKTLLVGGGITSSLISFLLQNQSGLCATTLDIWEKDDVVGGRMKSVSSPYSNKIAIDIGAQYLTTNSDKLIRYNSVYDPLISNGIIEELNTTIKNLRPQKESKNYVAPNGMSSLIRHFLSTSRHNLHLSRDLKSLNVNNAKIEAETTTGLKEIYEAVVLTMPVPQVLKLSGNFINFVDPAVLEKLKKVQFSSRYAMVLIYERKIPEQWGAYYTPDDSLIKYIAIQEIKANLPSFQSSVIIHSSTDLDEKFTHGEDIKTILLNHVNQLFPTWGQPADVIFYKWDYSQVTTAFQTPSKMLVLNEKPLLILAGDSFSRSNFENCIESARNASDLLKANVSF